MAVEIKDNKILEQFGLQPDTQCEIEMDKLQKVTECAKNM